MQHYTSQPSAVQKGWLNLQIEKIPRRFYRRVNPFLAPKMNCLCIERQSLHLMPERDLFLIPIYLSTVDYQHKYLKTVDFTVTRRTRLTSFRISIVFRRGARWFILSRGKLSVDACYSHAKGLSHASKGLTRSSTGRKFYLSRPGDPWAGKNRLWTKPSFVAL